MLCYFGLFFMSNISCYLLFPQRREPMNYYHWTPAFAGVTEWNFMSHSKSHGCKFQWGKAHEKKKYWFVLYLRFYTLYYQNPNKNGDYYDCNISTLEC